ncbi:MAG: tryptophan--tRNA ligase [Clostridia bacterium]|nr:tryptophan--tRNA ligase [Clostridia bacterium]MBP5648613.1 tryptophan--tRNA ligase [Clostridia bacterium]
MEESITQRKRVYSALKPTGDLQLGNYIGALKNMVKLQEDYDCIYTVADMHSITVDCVPAELRKRTYDFMALFLAIGLDPEKTLLFVQSHVSAHAELTWVLNCNTMMGEASRMTQFKDKSKKAGKSGINVGLFDYPVLMASDILLYQADLVPVGKDQLQHLELARNIAERFNNRYSATFTLPEPYVGNKATSKIFNLLDPKSKMGKTDDSVGGVIFLLDQPDVIMKKFSRAVTDSECEIKASASKPGITNLLGIYSAVTGKTVAAAEKEFAGRDYAYFKKAVGEAVVEHLRPIQSEYKRYISDKATLEKIMKDGADKASYIARKTLSKVYRKVGFVI